MIFFIIDKNCQKTHLPLSLIKRNLDNQFNQLNCIMDYWTKIDSEWYELAMKTQKQNKS